MSKKKNTLLRNTSILMAATIISRVIGLLYRSPLGETIGNEGLGYYSTASNLYTILLLISSYSIPMAVSKIVSERLALKEYRNAHRVFHGALIYAVIVGGIAALVAFFGGKFLLPYNQQNALLALRVLAPTIFFSAVLGVLRGYFQAHSTMMPTSSRYSTPHSVLAPPGSSSSSSRQTIPNMPNSVPPAEPSEQEPVSWQASALC